MLFSFKFSGQICEIEIDAEEKLLNLVPVPERPIKPVRKQLLFLFSMLFRGFNLSIDFNTDFNTFWNKYTDFLKFS